MVSVWGGDPPKKSGSEVLLPGRVFLIRYQPEAYEKAPLFSVDSCLQSVSVKAQPKLVSIIDFFTKKASESSSIPICLSAV